MANNQNDPSRTDDKVDIFISGWSEVATTLKYIHVSHEQTSIDKKDKKLNVSSDKRWLDNTE